jgi:hypothetical protein
LTIMATTPRLLRTLGVIHYVLGALTCLGFVLSIMGMFWVSIPQNPSAPESVDTKFGIDVAEITLGIVAICFIVLAPIAFLLGNRLYCRRWRVFCVVLAVSELLWGFIFGAVIGFIFFTELYTMQPYGTAGTIVLAILSGAIAGIPIVLAIITITFLGLPTADTSFTPLIRHLS